MVGGRTTVKVLSYGSCHRSSRCQDNNKDNGITLGTRRIYDDHSDMKFSVSFRLHRKHRSRWAVIWLKRQTREYVRLSYVRIATMMLVVICSSVLLKGTTSNTPPDMETVYFGSLPCDEHGHVLLVANDHGLWFVESYRDKL